MESAGMNKEELLNKSFESLKEVGFLYLLFTGVMHLYNTLKHWLPLPALTYAEETPSLFFWSLLIAFIIFNYFRSYTTASCIFCGREELNN